MPRCVDVYKKGGKLVFRLETPLFGKYEIVRQINTFEILTTLKRKDMVLYSEYDNVVVKFVEFYEDLGAGIRPCVMCYIRPDHFNYVTSHAVWDKVVALLS